MFFQWENRQSWGGVVFLYKVHEKVAREECDGSRRRRPPSLIGRASKSLSVEEHNGCPVNPGMRCWCVAFSSRCSKSSMSWMLSQLLHMWDEVETGQLQLNSRWLCLCLHFVVYIFLCEGFRSQGGTLRCCLLCMVICTSVSPNASMGHASWFCFTTR